MQKILLIIRIIFRNMIRSKEKKIEFLYLFGGIILSVALLTATMGLFQGYVSTLKKSILGSVSHVYIFKDGISELDSLDLELVNKTVKNYDEVNAVQAIIMGKTIATHNNKIKAAIVKGMDFTSKQTSEIRNSIVEGSSDISSNSEIIIGSKFAELLQLKTGDILELTTPAKTKITPFGIMQKKHKCKVIGIVESGMYEYDSTYIFSNYELANEFSIAKDYFTEIEIKLNQESIDDADLVTYKLQRELGDDYQVHSWKFFNESLFASLQLQKYALFIILCLLIIIATFNVISFVSANISQYKKQIGILMSFGMRLKQIRIFFISQVFIFASTSIIIGIASGFLLALFVLNQSIYKLNAKVYMIENFSLKITPSLLYIIYFVAISIVIISTLIPLRKLRKINVIDIIREA